MPFPVETNRGDGATSRGENAITNADESDRLWGCLSAPGLDVDSVQHCTHSESVDQFVARKRMEYAFPIFEKKRREQEQSFWSTFVAGTNKSEMRTTFPNDYKFMSSDMDFGLQSLLGLNRLTEFNARRNAVIIPTIYTLNIRYFGKGTDTNLNANGPEGGEDVSGASQEKSDAVNDTDSVSVTEPHQTAEDRINERTFSMRRRIRAAFRLQRHWLCDDQDCICPILVEENSCLIFAFHLDKVSYGMDHWVGVVVDDLHTDQASVVVMDSLNIRPSGRSGSGEPNYHAKIYESVKAFLGKVFSGTRICDTCSRVYKGKLRGQETIVNNSRTWLTKFDTAKTKCFSPHLPTQEDDCQCGPFTLLSIFNFVSCVGFADKCKKETSPGSQPEPFGSYNHSDALHLREYLEHLAKKLFC